MRATGQRGFTIVSAIFILVVLAALGAFIAVVSTTQQVGSAMDVQGARAYQAARAGIEWGAYQVWANNATRNGAGASNSCGFANASFGFPAAAATLSGFTVTVSCTRTPDPAGAANGGPAVYSITAVACNMPVGGPPAACPGAAGSANYVERRITVTL